MAVIKDVYSKSIVKGQFRDEQYGSKDE